MSATLDAHLQKLSAEELAVWKLRHSTEHVLTQAMQNLYGKDAVYMAMGPATAEGFYFDFECRGDFKVNEDMFPEIEAEMSKIIAKNLPITQKIVSAEEAKALFTGNPYKQEWLEEIGARGEQVSLFWTGDQFVDLCAGPHVENTREIRAFKLLKVAGAYWHGDEKKAMLTRVYGTAYPTQEALDIYLKQQEEAKKRDHRKLGRELGLYCISQAVGGGFPLYMPNGFQLRRALENWLTQEKESRGFQFVWTPHVAKSDLYVQSGHWQKYDAMFPAMKIDDEEFVIKPMNCPHHFQIFNAEPRSYRDLPLVLAENATVYRYEKAGELNGLLRVRALTQDDTHAFVRHSQIADQIDGILELAFMVYKTFGFEDFTARISIRDPKHPEKYMGNPETWDKAELALEEAAKRHEVKYYLGEGEAAFYGPKIDVMVKDALGREWQLTTVQLDFVQPENFDMHYTNEAGQPERPAVLHVAILGSVDRFLGILIEHYAGAFPLWLAPVQVAIVPISQDQSEYAGKVLAELKASGIRAIISNEAESMQNRIRKAEQSKILVMLVVGKREEAEGSVAVRRRGSRENTVLSIQACVALLTKELRDHNISL